MSSAQRKNQQQQQQAVPPAVVQSVNGSSTDDGSSSVVKMGAASNVTEEPSSMWGMSWTKAEYMLRILLALTYIVGALATVIRGMGKNGCFVKNTYRQEFASNIVADPFLASSSVFRNSPRSGLEMTYYDLKNYTQMASDTMVFPNVIYDPFKHAAFWPVSAEPSNLSVAGQTIPSTRKYGWVYYYDADTGRVSSIDPPVQSALAPWLDSAIVASVHGDKRAGMQLPNLARCLERYTHLPPQDDGSSTSLEEAANLASSLRAGNSTWHEQLARLRSNSHLRGTCLLTGQQATVDITSNPRTSMTPFSSVNVLFMLVVVLWITASFAVFDIAGWIKDANDEQDAQRISLDNDPKEEMSCTKWWCGPCKWWTSDDFAVFIAILWNLILILCLMIPNVRADNNIPLNNAVIAVALLLAAILVQWNTSNIYIDTQDAAAKTALTTSNDPADEETKSYVAKGIPVEGQPTAPEMVRQTTTKYSSVPGASPVSMFDTSNFLSTASAVREYGVQCARAITSINQNQQLFNTQNSGGLRKRAVYGRSDHQNEDGTMYRPVRTGTMFNAKERRKQRLYQMPAYTAMVSYGSPVARYNYRNIMKKEKMDDSVQSMGYTLTNPLLFASILPVLSPTVPTGMVQWVFGSLLGSHLLCIPILYMSHMSATYRRMYPGHFHWKTNAVAIACFLGACAILQAIGLTIFILYFQEAASFYTINDSFKSSVLMLLVMQCFFVVTVVEVSIAAMVDKYGVFEKIAYGASMLYSFFNLLIKMVAPLVILAAVEQDIFPVLSCNAWEGNFRHATP